MREEIEGAVELGGGGWGVGVDGTWGEWRQGEGLLWWW